MRILFIEDTEMWINEYLPSLKTLGEVFHCKGLKNATKLLNQEIFDLIVCDHNIIVFENSRQYLATGLDIYLEYQELQLKIPFIHFSAEPCPGIYPHENDNNFYSLKKEMGVNLINFINKINNLQTS